MKHKIFLIVFLLTGCIMNLNGQKKEEEREIQNRQAWVVAVNENGVWHSMFNSISAQRVSLNLSKHFRGETISSEVDFEVADDQTSISINLAFLKNNESPKMLYNWTSETAGLYSISFQRRSECPISVLSGEHCSTDLDHLSAYVG